MTTASMAPSLRPARKPTKAAPLPREGAVPMADILGARNLLESTPWETTGPSDVQLSAIRTLAIGAHYCGTYVQAVTVRHGNLDCRSTVFFVEHALLMVDRLARWIVMHRNGLPEYHHEQPGWAVIQTRSLPTSSPVSTEAIFGAHDALEELCGRGYLRSPSTLALDAFETITSAYRDHNADQVTVTKAIPPRAADAGIAGRHVFMEIAPFLIRQMLRTCRTQLAAARPVVAPTL